MLSFPPFRNPFSHHENCNGTLSTIQSGLTGLVCGFVFGSISYEFLLSSSLLTKDEETFLYHLHRQKILLDQQHTNLIVLQQYAKLSRRLSLALKRSSPSSSFSPSSSSFSPSSSSSSPSSSSSSSPSSSSSSSVRVSSSPQERSLLETQTYQLQERQDQLWNYDRFLRLSFKGVEKDYRQRKLHSFVFLPFSYCRSLFMKSRPNSFLSHASSFSSSLSSTSTPEVQSTLLSSPSRASTVIASKPPSSTAGAAASTLSSSASSASTSSQSLLTGHKDGRKETRFSRRIHCRFHLWKRRLQVFSTDQIFLRLRVGYKTGVAFMVFYAMESGIYTWLEKDEGSTLYTRLTDWALSALYLNSFVGKPLDLRSFSSSSSPASFFKSSPSNSFSHPSKTRLHSFSSSFSSLSSWKERFGLHARDSWNRFSPSFSRLSKIPSLHTPFTLSFSTLFFFRASVDLFFYLCQIGCSFQGDDGGY